MYFYVFYEDLYWLKDKKSIRNFAKGSRFKRDAPHGFLKPHARLSSTVECMINPSYSYSWKCIHPLLSKKIGVIIDDMSMRRFIKGSELDMK